MTRISFLVRLELIVWWQTPASNGTKTEAVFIRYLQYGINCHKFYLCLGRSVRGFLFQSRVLLSHLCMVTSAEIQNPSFCNRRSSILSEERLFVLFNLFN